METEAILLIRQGAGQPYRRVQATLTDEHAASSYGQPVAVFDGQAHGRGDIAGYVECVLSPDVDPQFEVAIVAAGWRPMVTSW